MKHCVKQFICRLHTPQEPSYIPNTATTIADVVITTIDESRGGLVPPHHQLFSHTSTSSGVLFYCLQSRVCETPAGLCETFSRGAATAAVDDCGGETVRETTCIGLSICANTDTDPLLLS